MFAEGAVVGEYTLQWKLGQGPLAEVWRAKKIDRIDPVALKLLRPGVLAPSAMRRAFDRLVAVLGESGRLDHAHLPQALGTVRRPSDGLFGLSAPYFDGGPLFDAGDLTKPSALRDALELIVQLGQTVMWLHDQGFVHGAIKPTNVLAAPGSTGPSIQLLDLSWSRAGLCRLDGTRFEPPELRYGPATPASDQWAIARLVRGLVARRAAEPIGAWSRVPVDLRRAVERSLSENPGQRFPRTAELIDAIVAAQTSLSVFPETREDPDRLPAPTVPVEPQSQVAAAVQVDTVVPNSAPAARPLRVHDADAPTEPALPESGRAKVQALARQARTVDFEPAAQVDPTSPDELSGIDPSADSDTPSGMVRPPRASDPTAPVPPSPNPPRAISLPLIVIFAALAAVAVYAWTVLPEPFDLTALLAPASNPTPPPVPSPKLSREPVAAIPSVPPVEPTRPASNGPVRSATPTETAPATAKAPPPPAPLATAVAPSSRSESKQIETAAKDHAWTECSRGVRQACIALSQQHERQRHWNGAAKARDQACRQGHRSSCLLAARHFLRIGQTKTARRKYERLCDRRVAQACAQLAVLFDKGIGGRRSPRAASAFLTRACKLGHRSSCQ